MQTRHKLSKLEERELMRMLKDRRERQTPQRASADWVAAYWRRLAS